MSIPIEFYVMGLPTQRKKPGSKLIEQGVRVREYFRMQSIDGKIDSFGEVDDNVRKGRAKEYAEFRKLMDEQEDVVHEAARNAPGTRVYPVQMSKER